MGRVREARGRDRLILDAGALIALARGDTRARSLLEIALDEGSELLVPTPVLAQVHRAGHDHAHMDRVLGSIDEYLPTTVKVARQAGELLGRAGHSDAIDGIVAAEALNGAPAAIMTSDLTDITDLVEAGGGSRRVAVHRV